MKKNIDPNKVSSFKNTEMSYHKHSTFCMKTKPNKRYFNGEVKRLTQEMKNDLCTEELKQKDPALYFSILGKKMPKKYLKLYETKAEVKEVKVPVTAEIKKDQVEETKDERFESVVVVKTGSGMGSGFFISDDEIITNYHVVEGAMSISIIDKNNNK